MTELKVNSKWSMPQEWDTLVDASKEEALKDSIIQRFVTPPSINTPYLGEIPERIKQKIEHDYFEIDEVSTQSIQKQQQQQQQQGKQEGKQGKQEEEQGKQQQQQEEHQLQEEKDVSLKQFTISLIDPPTDISISSHVGIRLNMFTRFSIPEIDETWNVSQIAENACPEGWKKVFDIAKYELAFVSDLLDSKVVKHGRYFPL